MLATLAIFLREYFLDTLSGFWVVLALWLVAFGLEFIRRRMPDKGCGKKVLLVAVSVLTLLCALLAFALLATVAIIHQYYFSDAPAFIPCVNVSGVPVYGEARPEQLRIIRMALDFSPPTVRRPQSIRIFGERWLATLLYFPKGAIACTYPRTPSSIVCCLDSSAVGCDAIWHELGHVHHNALPPVASTEWLAVSASFFYSDDKSVNRESFFPRQGIWTAYGATAFQEDVAVWVETCYEMLASGLNSFYLARDPANPCWRNKLFWLHRWGFITFKQLCRLEGCRQLAELTPSIFKAEDGTLGGLTGSAVSHPAVGSAAGLPTDKEGCIARMALSLACLIFLILYGFIHFTSRFYFLKWRLIFGGWGLATGFVAIWAGLVFLGAIIIALMAILIVEMALFYRVR